MSVITIERKVLEKNDQIAQRNRELFARHGIFVFNLVSSPGSGKTTILEKTLARLSGVLRIAVIEGDIATDHDARRLQQFDIPVIQINTEGGCHLDSYSIAKAFASLFNLRALYNPFK